jgi:hypothetical protein
MGGLLGTYELDLEWLEVFEG